MKKNSSERFVPFDKLSKKEQRSLNRLKRTEWQFSPVTRVRPSKKIYDRKKLRADPESRPVLFLCFKTRLPHIPSAS